MNKYINADKLKECIIKLEADSCVSEYKDGFSDGICCVFDTIDTLQQEQPDSDLEKAAQHVYESWMGGTMDDVRRDMVELGRVINARKEE